MDTETHQRTTDRGPLTVFVVDDEESYTDLTAQFIERGGSVSVETFTDPGQAMAALDDGVDCVVSDYRMPGTDGRTVLERAKGQRPGVPFVFFTVYERSDLPESAVESATAVVEKSTDLEQFRELRRTVERAVQTRLEPSKADRS